MILSCHPSIGIPSAEENCLAQGHDSFPGWLVSNDLSAWECKGLIPVFQLETALKGCPSGTPTHGVSWGFTGTALHLSFYLGLIRLHSLLFHKCWSWKHSSINFSYTNLHLKVRFWGNPTGDNRILSPISWTHYVTVTRRITNYNSWTYQKGLYMLSMCFPCLEYPGCFCQANSHSSSKTQLKTQFHHLLEASSNPTSIPNMCSFRSLCFPLSHILLYQSVIIYLLACARLRLS